MYVRLYSFIKVYRGPIKIFIYFYENVKCQRYFHFCSESKKCHCDMLADAMYYEIIK